MKGQKTFAVIVLLIAACSPHVTPPSEAELRTAARANAAMHCLEQRSGVRSPWRHVAEHPVAGDLLPRTGWVSTLGDLNVGLPGDATEVFVIPMPCSSNVKDRIYDLDPCVRVTRTSSLVRGAPYHRVLDPDLQTNNLTAYSIGGGVTVTYVSSDLTAVASCAPARSVPAPACRIWKSLGRGRYGVQAFIAGEHFGQLANVVRRLDALLTENGEACFVG